MSYPRPYYGRPRMPRASAGYIRTTLAGIACLIALGLLSSDVLTALPYGLGAIISSLFEVAGYVPIVIIGLILLITGVRITGTKMIAFLWLVVSILPGLAINTASVPLSVFAPIVSAIPEVVIGLLVALFTIGAIMCLVPKY
ncbi:hypothetical protein GYY_03055 [Methanococcus maripaludis X1]|uniref:Uncharacterized protein n=1 Tax=Methanococcus maripaludis X1 TaxID=1053692 RepID=G0H424_METMI|nr:hypothetical protein [Methanococcus maripaludis]AEK19490.1 hypothetical protein GYY_03055 [Methanococcus maripaludis X1]